MEQVAWPLRDKTEFLYLKLEAISTLSGRPLKLVGKFTYVDSNISSTESDANIRLVIVWSASDK